MSFQRYVIGLLLAAGIAPPAFAQPNPYGVSGANWNSNGVMVKLGMPGGANDPSGSIAYIWDTLQPTNVPNMVRPKRYWEYVGANPDRIQGYDHETDTLTHPVEFGQWVEDHPGTIWIIGNEPDMGAGQDGLTPAEYARMFHTFHDFIRVQGRDPTAKFANAALGALAYTSWLNDDIAWWNNALNEYETQFGGDMPIDIWNCHCYAILGDLDPQRVIDVYFEPFHNYTRTVRGGVYADTGFWITEFGLGPDVHPEIGAEFMKQLCPRLEAFGVDRFFWFLGPYASGWEDEALLGPDGQPNLMGTTYSELAHSYPNPIPRPSPLQAPFPAPPGVVSDDFETDTGAWKIMAGTFVLDGGTYRQTRQSGSCWMASYLPYTYRNVRMEADVRINSYVDAQSWVGLTLRSGFVWSGGDTKTYLVFLRQNGELGVWTQADGAVATVAGAVADMSGYHRLAVDVFDQTVRVSVDGQEKLVWTDPNARRSEGLVSLRTCNTNASFDNVVVTPLCDEDADRDDICDGEDNCVNVINPAQADGDADGVGDACDDCPGTPAGDLIDAAGCSLPFPGDMDQDRDVDLEDFGQFQACLSGDGHAQTMPSCGRALLDDDDDVDELDLTLFQGCMTGPGIEADQLCAP